jgi:TonB family protein
MARWLLACLALAMVDAASAEDGGAEHSVKSAIAWFEPPAYEQQWRAAGLEGTVSIAATIGSDGSAHSIRVVSAPSVFDAAVMDSMRHWLFQLPTCVRAGKPEYHARLDVAFEHEGDRYFVAVRNARYSVSGRAPLAAGLHTPLKRIAGEDPRYHKSVRTSAGKHAVALATFRVLKDGSVDAIEFHSAPTQLFDEEIQRALQQWRFEPPLGATGEPQVTRACVELKFDGE